MRLLPGPSPKKRRTESNDLLGLSFLRSEVWSQAYRRASTSTSASHAHVLMLVVIVIGHPLLLHLTCT
ncbi:hypothetical protein CPAR01_16325 [Colletotrichum paranaense]|uniref:Uncharacterized protein n=1 Tax=Colletotrichum paranaense TaxID=1914294 RepID=A0ABQ9RXQ1_9PEZI|nr:uncharacterized protein CPAR01_16325 [Colletotrichum paranaense]KAK1516709.1 hypothetical protein CPAR01_16325 [Colletotrichum paranaense]